MSNVPLSERVLQFGLTEVFSPPDPRVDIVFVHGLNGHPFNTWATHKPETFWPADLLPSALEEQKCRILTYGFDANVTAFTDGTSKDKIHNHAEHLASRLVANRALKKALERPVIFVCHSLGGLVVKRCLVYSKNVRHTHTERTRSIYVSTYGILFLGTPHNGSDLAKWGTLLERISSAVLPKKFFDSSPQLVQALKTNNETLQNINRLFIEIIGRYHIYFFHEGKPMDLKGTRDFVVDEESAAPVIEGVERMVIERDHSHMCKFESENAPGYDVVAEALLRYADDAPNLIRTRWNEERHIRDFEKQEAAKELLRDSSLAQPSLTPNDSSQPSQSTSMVSSTASIKQLEGPQRESIQGPRLVTPLGFRPNSLFIGFQFELDQLHTRLHSKKRRELGSCSVLIWGDPGCGKSHLCRQYFYRHRHENPEGSFWVDCKNKSTILNGFLDIGTSIGALDQEQARMDMLAGSEDFVDAVRKGLEALEGWLLVFDGLSFESDNNLEAFKRFIPDRSGNSIIITSVDRTLAKRQRLLNPPAVKVHALTISEACELLYRSLSIRKPSTAQQAKAVELVKDNQCLPLAIHAAAHALIERGKALERYSHNMSDIRLKTPFLQIIQALRDKLHYEALNLITLLSFFNHYVPVALVNYGYRGLQKKPFEVEIRSPKYTDSGRYDLDSTISILLRSGLIERTLQAYPIAASGHHSPEETRAAKQTINGHATSQAEAEANENTPLQQLNEESSGLELVLARLETTTDDSSAKSTTSTIDVLRTHTVVQNVIRDELRDQPVMNLHQDFWWWLSAAVCLLTSAFATAHGKMRKASGGALLRDYREFESQATRLWSFFPKSESKASSLLRKSRHELHQLIRIVRREMRNQSPSQSSDSSNRHFQGSVFEYSSMTSDDDTHSPESDLTRASTWSLHPEREPSESPTEMLRADTADAEWGWADDEAAVLSDSDSWQSHSETTEMPRQRRSDRSRRSSALRAIFEGRPRLGNKDLGEWKPAPVAPSLSLKIASNASSDTLTPRPGTSGSDAEASLAAMHRSSPPAARGGRPRSISRGSMAQSDRPPLAARSTNVSLSPLTAEFHPSGLPPAKADPSSKVHSRNPSASPRLVQALLNKAAATSFDSPPVHILSTGPLQNTVSSTHLEREIAQQSKSRASYLPTGYTSVPMSRHVSQGSTNLTYGSDDMLPNSLPLRSLSDIQSHGEQQPRYRSMLPDIVAHSFDDRDTLDAGPSEEAPRSVIAGNADDWNLQDQEHPNSGAYQPMAFQFGQLEPVDLEQARDRLAIARERSTERTRGRPKSRRPGSQPEQNGTRNSSSR